MGQRKQISLVMRSVINILSLLFRDLLPWEYPGPVGNVEICQELVSIWKHKKKFLLQVDTVMCVGLIIIRIVIRYKKERSLFQFSVVFLRISWSWFILDSRSKIHNLLIKSSGLWKAHISIEGWIRQRQQPWFAVFRSRTMRNTVFSMYSILNKAGNQGDMKTRRYDFKATWNSGEFLLAKDIRHKIKARSHTFGLISCRLNFENSINLYFLHF